MSTTRTAKEIASRLNHSYIRRTGRRRLVRRGLIAFVFAGTLVIWGVYANRGDQTIYSPGPLTSVHAMWDGNNCAWCHEPQAGGGFSQVVTDNACIRCHDSAVHHHNQATMVALDAAGKPTTSANCVSCHNEHRGQEELVARADATCTRCHSDLPPTTRDGKTAMQPRITAFASGEHPAFGRSLTAEKVWSTGKQALTDPTPINFNHQAHQVHVKPLAGEAENCTKCHQPTADAHGGMDWASIAPVSYERHCAECHSLNLVKTANIIVPHESLEVVRPFLAGALSDLPTQFRNELNAMPETARKKELVTVRMVPRPPLAPIKKEVQITPEEWVAKRVDAVRGELRKWYEEVGPTIPGFDSVKAVVESQAAPAGGVAAQDPWLAPPMVEFYAAHIQPGIKSQNKCNLCHDLSDDKPTVDRLRLTAGAPMSPRIAERIRLALLPTAVPGTSPATAAATTAPATRPATTVAPLATLATGLAEGPRRWFINSKFDHRAHRSVTCSDCHGQAATSVLTSDVLMPAMESCLACHTPQNTMTSTGGAAGSSCQLCHDYHNRSFERSGNGWMHGTDLLKPHPPAAPPPATRPSGAKVGTEP